MTNALEDITSALENTRVSPKGVSFAGQSLKLNTAEDAQVVVEAINNSEGLEYLNLEGNTLGVEAARAIANALEKQPKFKRALWKDMFTGRMKTEIPKALQYLGVGLVKAGARLVVLDLSDNAFGPIGVDGLASLLRSSSCYALEELRLNNNGLGITGGKLLAGALMDCFISSTKEGKSLALKVFIAGRNRLENKGAEALSDVFSTIGTLEEIAMPQNGIYHYGISKLSKAFTANHNLQILNLNDNTIGPKGVEAIAKALPNLQKLRVINFGDCLLKTKGAHLLAGALAVSHSDLEELILESNEIRSEGGLALVEALANKTKLKSIILDGNQFNKAGRTKIMEKLRDMGKLNVLGSLDDCDSDEEEEDEDEAHQAESNTETEGSSDEEEPRELTIQDLSLKTKPINFIDFFNSPTAENYLNLGNNAEEIFLKGIEQQPTDFLPLLMKVSALCVTNQDKVSKSALISVKSLYKQFFMQADKDNQLPNVNNDLLVNLGLIKGEDKTLKPSWKLEGCFAALQAVVESNHIPTSTKSALTVFLERSIKEDSSLKTEKTKLLEALQK